MTCSPKDMLTATVLCCAQHLASTAQHPITVIQQTVTVANLRPTFLPRRSFSHHSQAAACPSRMKSTFKARYSDRTRLVHPLAWQGAAQDVTDPHCFRIVS